MRVCVMIRKWVLFEEGFDILAFFGAEPVFRADVGAYQFAAAVKDEGGGEVFVREAGEVGV